MKNTQLKHSNKITYGAFTKPTICLMFLLALSACGQRGALFIPAVPEAGQRSSIVETLSMPTNTDADKNSSSSTRAPMTSPASK